LADAIEILFDKLAVTKENACAFHRRRFPPGGERGSGALDCLIDHVGSAEWGFRDRLAARRIEDRRRGDTG